MTQTYNNGLTAKVCGGAIGLSVRAAYEFADLRLAIFVVTVMYQTAGGVGENRTDRCASVCRRMH